MTYLKQEMVKGVLVYHKLAFDSDNILNFRIRPQMAIILKKAELCEILKL